MANCGNRGDGRQGRNGNPIVRNWATRKRSPRARKEYEERFANPFVAAERGFIDGHHAAFLTPRIAALCKPAQQAAERTMEKHDTIRSNFA